MSFLPPFPRLLSSGLALLVLVSPAFGQIPSHTDTGVRSYAAHGTTEQPFTIQVVGSRRTIENILLVKLSLTNNGTGPLTPGTEFAGDNNPADNNKISAVYAVDPNGRRKFPVIRDAGNVALCSTINPPVMPGERRMLYAQLSAPPDTSAVFDLYFPQARNRSRTSPSVWRSRASPALRTQTRPPPVSRPRTTPFLWHRATTSRLRPTTTNRTFTRTRPTPPLRRRPSKPSAA